MTRHFLILATVLLATPAFAAEAPDHDGPCKADAAKLCPDVKPGGGRIAACLREHKDAVSDACKARIQAHRARHGEARGGKEGDAGIGE